VRVVLDTNVLVAAFASRGLCEAVVEICLSCHEIFLSEPILGELGRHLKGKLKVPKRQANEILSLLRQQATMVEPLEVPAGACRDSADLAVLGTAAAAVADCLVTGGQDLLVLSQFRGVPILSPRAFHDKLLRPG